VRPDLTAQRQRYQGKTYWVLKDPVGLQYFRFQEEEYAILQMLDGDTSLDEIKEKFEAEFPPQKITLDEIQNFLGMLHRSGLILAGGAFVLFMGGLRWRWILSVLAAAVPVAVAMWFFFMHDYQKQRILTFLDPESDPLGTGWNIIQSKAAIGSGGVFGKGWLMGTQSHLDFLPESHTDFIIAVMGEEFGLVGICALLLIYLLLIGRGLVITAQAQTFVRQIAGGLVDHDFFVYVFVNIGMVSGLLPVVGVPLPFISYGGTSLVTLLSAFGVLMSIHTHRKWIAQV